MVAGHAARLNPKPFGASQRELRSESSGCIILTMNTLTLPEIVERLQAELPTLQVRYHVKTLELFGSYVRHEQQPASDVDILVTFDHTPSLWTVIDLEHHLTDILGVSVDLVLRDSLKPRIREQVLREVVPLRY